MNQSRTFLIQHNEANEFYTFTTSYLFFSRLDKIPQDEKNWQMRQFQQREQRDSPHKITDGIVIMILQDTLNFAFDKTR